MRQRSVLFLVAAALLTGCGSSPHHGGAKLQVVAAENFWGSIATQLAGTRGDVQSIIVNPDTDPHDYEPTPSDARLAAGATMEIVNGIGYDPWAPKLFAASPVSGRQVLDVGDLLGLKDGDNPHQWYSPTSVRKVVAAMVADYDRLDPADASYFAARERLFETKDLAEYDQLVVEIKARYHGVAVGYSESIFQPLGQALGLKLATPYSFAKAIAEGTDLSASDRETVDGQAEKHQIAVWIFNSQNVTPDVERVNAIARREHIPIVTITETLSPANATFEGWQVAELKRLLAALAKGTGF